jgi:hypothetical protein
MSRHVAFALIAVLSLAGCSTAAADQSQPTPTSGVTATVTPTPTPTKTAAAPETATASPPVAAPEAPASPDTSVAPEAPDAPAAAAGCDTVLTDAEYASLAEDGLILNPHVRVLDAEMQTIMDQGLGCYWTRGGGDVRVWYAQADQDTETWTALSQQLVGAGWTPSNDPIEGTFTAPADRDPSYTPSIVHVDGVTYYASYAAFFPSVKALAG